MASGDCTMHVVLDASKLELKPGDKIWIETPQTLTPSQIGVVKQVVKDWSGIQDDEAILILHSGMKLRILSKEKADDVSTGNP